jgi:hypothetical protein
VPPPLFLSAVSEISGARAGGRARSSAPVSPPVDESSSPPGRGCGGCLRAGTAVPGVAHQLATRGGDPRRRAARVGGEPEPCPAQQQRPGGGVAEEGGADGGDGAGARADAAGGGEQASDPDLPGSAAQPVTTSLRASLMPTLAPALLFLDVITAT